MVKKIQKEEVPQRVFTVEEILEDLFMYDEDHSEY